MKTFVPNYFKKFSCIAGACPDSCCIGWEADLDSEILEKYKSVGGELGERIKNALAKDETDCDIFALCKNGRCPFLNSKNLCDIQATHGEEYLSITCAMFPRFFESFGNKTEMGLGFGCPEAARIMLDDDEPFSLTLLSDNGIEEECDDTELSFIEELTDSRDSLIEILDTDGLSFRQKAELLYEKAVPFQCRIDNTFTPTESPVGDNGFDFCLRVMKEMEYISEERRKVIDSITDSDRAEEMLVTYQSDFERLMKYYIYRYVLSQSSDVVSAIEYGLFACVIISRIYASYPDLDEETRIKIMYGYSKEVEYSDVNMELLDEAVYMYLDTEAFLNML